MADVDWSVGQGGYHHGGGHSLGLGVHTQRQVALSDAQGSEQVTNSEPQGSDQVTNSEPQESGVCAERGGTGRSGALDTSDDITVSIVAVKLYSVGISIRT